MTVAEVLFEINGTRRKLKLDTRTTLLDALREHLHLTGTSSNGRRIAVTSPQFCVPIVRLFPCHPGAETPRDIEPAPSLPLLTKLLTLDLYAIRAKIDLKTVGLLFGLI